jgi:hypothetical protein
MALNEGSHPVIQCARTGYDLKPIEPRQECCKVEQIHIDLGDQVNTRRVWWVDVERSRFKNLGKSNGQFVTCHLVTTSANTQSTTRSKIGFGTVVKHLPPNFFYLQWILDRINYTGKPISYKSEHR